MIIDPAINPGTCRTESTTVAAAEDKGNTANNCFLIFMNDFATVLASAAGESEGETHGDTSAESRDGSMTTALGQQASLVNALENADATASPSGIPSEPGGGSAATPQKLNKAKCDPDNTTKVIEGQGELPSNLTSPQIQETGEGANGATLPGMIIPSGQDGLSIDLPVLAGLPATRSMFPQEPAKPGVAGGAAPQDPGARVKAPTVDASLAAGRSTSPNSPVPGSLSSDLLVTNDSSLALPHNTPTPNVLLSEGRKSWPSLVVNQAPLLSEMQASTVVLPTGAVGKPGPLAPSDRLSASGGVPATHDLQAGDGKTLESAPSGDADTGKPKAAQGLGMPQGESTTLSNNMDPSGRMPDSRESAGQGDSAIPGARRSQTDSAYAETGADKSKAGTSTDSEVAPGKILPTQLRYEREAGPGGADIDAARKLGSIKEKSLSVHSSPGAVSDGETPPATQTRPAQVAPPKAPEFVLQLADRIQVQIQNGESHIRIQLKPEVFGQLEVRAENGVSGLVVRIATESVSVRDHLESTLSILHQNLQDQGLKVDRIEVVLQNAFDPRQLAGQQQPFGQTGNGDGEGAANNSLGVPRSVPAGKADSAALEQVSWFALNPNSTFHTVA